MLSTEVQTEARPGNKSFLEYKFVFEVPSNGKAAYVEVPIGQITGGRRLRAAVAAATHRKNN
jgi:hypothetical protein